MSAAETWIQQDPSSSSCFQRALGKSTQRKECESCLWWAWHLYPKEACPQAAGAALWSWLLRDGGGVEGLAWY